MIIIINIIFVVLFSTGLIYSCFTNRLDIVTNCLLNSPKEAFLLFLDIYSLLIFWGGILRISKDSGLFDKISKYLIVIIKPLFKKIDKNDEALKYISLNILANMLSLGSCATPFGLKAIKRLKEINNNSDIASDEMITFLLINTSGVCIIPTLIISIRNQYSSSNPTIVIPYILLISTITTVSAIILDYGVRKIGKH